VDLGIIGVEFDGVVAAASAGGVSEGITSECGQQELVVMLNSLRSFACALLRDMYQIFVIPSCDSGSIDYKTVIFPVFLQQSCENRLGDAYLMVRTVFPILYFFHIQGRGRARHRWWRLAGYMRSLQAYCLVNWH